MEWPPHTSPLGPDPYPNPSPSLYPPEHEEYQNYQIPPTNPPWALRSQHIDVSQTAYPNEQGEVPLYPPPSHQVHQVPQSEQLYPPELSPHQEFPPESSALVSYPNWDSSQHRNGDSGAIPSQPYYPYLHSTDTVYPPIMILSGNFPQNSSSPHAFTSPSAPPLPLECSTVYPPPLNGAPALVQGHPPSAPNLPGRGPGLPFGCIKPTSAHPLLQSVEGDFVPFEEDGDDQSDDQSTGYGEEVDYSHKALEKYGTNLTTSAKEGSLDPVIGRDVVVRECIEILTRKSKCNPVLVGHPGVGKTAVVEGLAQRIVKGDVPEPLRKCKIISVDVGNIIAGTESRGQFEERMKELVDEATKAERKVILFLDELHRLIGAGKVVDTASDILNPALARGSFLCIGATTFDEYKKYVEKDPTLARRFEKVIVDPPSVEDTISILRGLKPRLESHHIGISIADDALIEAVKLSERYIPDRFLPDKAIDLVDVAASKLKVGLISKPAILDEIDRAILELDMERLSVTAATGPSDSQARLQQILSDLEGLKLRQTNLSRKWKKEKALATRIMSLREKVTAVKTGSSSVLRLESDVVKCNDLDEVHREFGCDEVHSEFGCDSCQMCPIIGPRYTHKTQFDMRFSQNCDLCQACHKVLLKDNGQIGDSFHRVEPPRLTCNGCSTHPIIGNYYYLVNNEQNMNNIRPVFCQICYRKAKQNQPSDSLNRFVEIHNNLKESQQPKKTTSDTDNLKELEAQLESAQKEWKEYQNSYKPLIQLEVTSMAIAEVLSSRTGIPATKMQASHQMQQLLQLDDELHKRVIGQDEACRAIARAIQRSRAGLSDPKRPIASLMFMGPTGVGKTELAKALAAHLFNSENAMVRIDMSEYAQKASITRLTGAAPAGLVGYQLTTPVRRQPYSVVLFDEIEKAHDDIFNIFLQILDDGRLTDSEGRVVNFTNTVIIMTSNVGAEMIMDSVTANYSSTDSEAYQVMKSQVMAAARDKYRPEFINRIDEFIVFQALNPQQLCEIVKLQLERVSKRLQERLINLRVSESAFQLLSAMGYDPRYGARPVKRVIQQSIEDPLAQGILRGQYTEGCTIMVDTEISRLGPSQQPKQTLTFWLAQLMTPSSHIQPVYVPSPLPAPRATPVRRKKCLWETVMDQAKRLLMEARGVDLLLEHLSSAFEKDMGQLQMLKADIARGVIDPNAPEPMLEAVQDGRGSTLLRGKDFLEMGMTSSAKRNLF